MGEELKGGHYKVEAPIGSGGMGVVYRAYDTRLKCRVALKEIKPEHAHNAEYRRRLSQEIRAAAAISHAGIASARDFVDNDDEFFIVYEYVEGVTLRDHLAKRRFKIDEVIVIGIQMAEALCAAHDRNVVHRDLKPENLMLVPRPEGRVQVKILDFGLAKFLIPPAELSQAGTSSATAAGVAVGTLNYMSPEQVQGKEADSRTDLYALGLVLYEMVTGRNPFRGETDASTIANIQMLDPPPIPDLNPECPPELDRILRKCLRKSKTERYQSAHELLMDFSRSPALRPSLEPRFDTEAEQFPRGLARFLFVLIQAGYLAMYTAAFTHPFRVEEFLARFKVPYLALIVLLSALVGASLRLWLLYAVGVDYPHTGRLFRWVFPAVLVLDAVWAASPLTLFYKLGYPVLLMMVGLAWLPFSQRTLVAYAYAPRGGRISSAGHKISSQRS